MTTASRGTAGPSPATEVASGPTLEDVVGDVAFLAGAPRRFLMEIALQPVGHGVADHSRALRDPVGRFRNTTAYIYLVAFGTPGEREAVIRMVNRARRRPAAVPGVPDLRYVPPGAARGLARGQGGLRRLCGTHPGRHHHRQAGS